jgi:Fungal specific transcription factor domain
MGPPPSLPFLNSCLDAYFRHFNVIFPFIHVPTFAASRTSPLLLTMICFTGALYLGTKYSRDLSFTLARRIHALVLMQLSPVVRLLIDAPDAYP